MATATKDPASGGGINLDSPAAPTSTAGGGGWNPYTTEQTQAAKQAEDADSKLNDSNVNPVRKEASKKTLKAAMRAANKHETKFTMTLMGNLDYIAGTCVQMDKTFGKFSGKYIFDKIVHSVRRGGGGYDCHVEGHLCLEGY